MRTGRHDDWKAIGCRVGRGGVIEEVEQLSSFNYDICEVEEGLGLDSNVVWTSRHAVQQVHALAEWITWTDHHRGSYKAYHRQSCQAPASTNAEQRATCDLLHGASSMAVGDRAGGAHDKLRVVSRSRGCSLPGCWPRETMKTPAHWCASRGSLAVVPALGPPPGPPRPSRGGAPFGDGR